MFILFYFTLIHNLNNYRNNMLQTSWISRPLLPQHKALAHFTLICFRSHKINNFWHQHTVMLQFTERLYWVSNDFSMYVFGSLSPDLHTDCSRPWSMLGAQSRPDIHMLRLVHFLQQALRRGLESCSGFTGTNRFIELKILRAQVFELG